MTTPKVIEANDLYPLPSDYYDLTVDGQRAARVNACQQWRVVPTGPALLAALNFFDHYYLWPDDDFDPGFYDQQPLELSPMHNQIIIDWGDYPLCIDVCPRGFTKTKGIQKAILLELLTVQRRGITYASCTHDLAKVTGNTIRDQLHNNNRLNDDFSWYWGRQLRVKRGEAIAGIEHFTLGNKSWLMCRSVLTRQRGSRPRTYYLDDAEYDPAAATQMTLIREGMEHLIRKIIMPMLTHGDMSLRWLGTIISKRHYIWHATRTNPSERGPLAEDPLFNSWMRRIIRAGRYLPDGTLISSWPQMWPATREERLARIEKEPRLRRAFSLMEMRDETMGRQHFDAEMMAQPSDPENAYFGVLTKEKHGWWYENVDDNVQHNPHSSTATICFYSKGNLLKLALPEFLKQAKLFITMDTAYTSQTTSDWKVATLMAFLPTTAELFALEMFETKKPQSVLVTKALSMAQRWRVGSIHPEVVRESIVLYEELVARTTALKQLNATETEFLYVPRIIKITPGMARKQDKIAALDVRFTDGLIKFPMDWAHSKPWCSLFEQIQDFRPDVDNGGLAHDDHIDTVAMSLYVIRSRWLPQGAEAPQLTPMERLKRGELYDESGLPLGLRIDWHSASSEDVHALLALREGTSTQTQPLLG